MTTKKKIVKTRQVGIPEKDFTEILPHIESYYGNIGKFYALAGKEKVIRDKKKLELIDTVND